MKISKKRRGLILFLAFAMLFTLPGCAQTTIYTKYKEVENLKIIRTLAIDRQENKDVVIAETGAGINGESPSSYKKKADSLAEAVLELQNSYIGTNSFFSHTEQVVIGEDAAKFGIFGYFDYINRVAEVRTGTRIFIAKGTTAEELITKSIGEEVATADMFRALEKSVVQLGEGYVFTCRDVAEKLERSSDGLIMAVELTESEETSSQEEGKKIISPAGFGILQKGNLVEYIPKELSLGATILLGKMKSAPINVIKKGMVIAALTITKAEVKWVPIFEDGILKLIQIKISCDADVEELNYNVNIESEKVRKEMAENISQQLLSQTEDVLALSQKTGCDFLDIETIVNQKEPIKFDSMQEEWTELFPKIPFSVSVETVIKRTFDLNEPISINGEVKTEDGKKQ